MKHLLLLIFVAICGYAGWNFCDKEERQTAMKLITKHGLRLGAIIVVLILLLAAAYYIPSTTLL